MPDPVVIIPGLMADGRAFAPLIQNLCHDRAVQIALPVGGDHIAGIAAATSAAVPARFSLIGHGLGAAVAIETARIAPERVTALVLINACAQAELPAVAAEQETLLVKAQAGALAEALWAAVGLDAVPDGAEKDAIRSAMAQMAFDLGLETFVAQLRALQRRPDQQRHLHALGMRTLVIGGDRDPIFPAKRQEFIASILPDARLKIMPGFAHLVPMEAPAKMTELIQSFLT